MHDALITQIEYYASALEQVTAEREALRAELAARDQLLAERVAIDKIARPTEDGPMCLCCGAMWTYEDDTSDVDPGSEWHIADCWVLRVVLLLDIDRRTDG